MRDSRHEIPVIKCRELTKIIVRLNYGDFSAVTIEMDDKVNQISLWP